MKRSLAHFPIIQTKHLILRSIQPDDHQELTEILQYRKNPTMDSYSFIKKIDTDFVNAQAISWGIEYQGELIGTCGYYRGFAHETGEIGYVMRKPFRGKGFMTEAIRAILDFGFKNLGLSTIMAYTKDQNIASVKLLNRLGFNRTEQLEDGYGKYERAK